jgi:hypothetical protein
MQFHGLRFSPLLLLAASASAEPLPLAPDPEPAIAPVQLDLALGRRGEPEVVILEDHFPGYAEDPDWDYSWNVGGGSTTFDAGPPGFAHLEVVTPADSSTYRNAEIKHYAMTPLLPPYCDYEIRLRNSNNNGWSGDGGAGSRGWGLWNDQMVGLEATVIWFCSISPQSAEDFRGTRLWIIRDGEQILLQDLGIDLTQWHTYRVQWRADYVGVFIDDMGSPIAEIRDPALIPDEGLSFTIWTDNYLIRGNFDEPLVGWLSLPADEKWIDVDYVRVQRFAAGRTSALP